MISISSTTPNIPENHRLLTYEDIDSTNVEAMRLIKSGEVGPLWIWGKKQTNGKGRSGRPWVSQDGNLFASLLMTLQCDIRVVAQLSLLAGIAAYDALVPLCSDEEKIRLKWPNDLLWDDAKIAGILLESSRLKNNAGIAVVIGTGINLRSGPDLRDRKTTDLVSQRQDISSEAALESLAFATARWLRIWKQGQGFDQIREAWMIRGQSIGTAVSVHSDAGIVKGHYAGLNEAGGMILQLSSGDYKDIHFGDVMVG